MKVTSVLLFLLLFCNTAETQSLRDKCKVNVELDVFIDTVYVPKDTVTKKPHESPGIFVDYAGYCNPCYSLKARKDKFTIVSFRILVETADDDLVEAFIEGNSLSGGRERQILNYAAPGTQVQLDCITARHENGNVYILKPLVFIR